MAGTFTESRDRVLRIFQDARRGAPTRELARKYRLSVGYVGQLLRGAGIRSGDPRKQRGRAIAEMAAAGASTAQIMRAFRDIAPHTIKHHCNALGVSLPPDFWKMSAASQPATPRIKQMREMRARGMTLERIAGHFGVTRERVRQLTANVELPRGPNWVDGVDRRDIYQRWEILKERYVLCEEWEDFPRFVKFFQSLRLRHRECLTVRDFEQPIGPDNYVVKKSSEMRNYIRSDRYAAFGKNLTLMEWSRSRHCQVSYSTLSQRLRKLGWPVEKAITMPPHAQVSVYYVVNR